MKLFAVLDTEVADLNVGNKIIMDSIMDEIDGLCDGFLCRLQFAEAYGKRSRDIMKASEVVFFGGTNSLSSNIRKYKQFGFTGRDVLHGIDNVLLFGVGWWQYQTAPTWYSSLFYKKILSSKYIHSVRDEYTLEKLKSIGIHNVVNTGCPTTWGLTKEHCSKIPEAKAHRIVFTLTDYNQSPRDDALMIDLLTQMYEEVYFWPQGFGDLDYFNSLALSTKRINVLKSGVKSLDNILSQGGVDYVGTRLHAGIRALQHAIRTLIIGVDNRAAEMSKDIGLPVLSRSGISDLQSYMNNDWVIDVKIKTDEIERWREQFKNGSGR